MSEIYSPVFSDAFAFKSLCPRLQRAPSSKCLMRSRRCVEEANGVVLSRRTHVEDVEHRQPKLTARSVAGN